MATAQQTPQALPVQRQLQPPSLPLEPSRQLPKPEHQPLAQEHSMGGEGQVGPAAKGARWPVLPADAAKRDAVRDAMRHAWGGYWRHAKGFDELDPVGLQGTNDLGGLGATVVDSLDTLFLMGLREEFANATAWVRESFRPGSAGAAEVNVFETTIRCLGGLMAAFDLTGEGLFLERASALGAQLLAAFRTPSGLGYGWCGLASGRCHTPHWAPGRVYLAEFGSMQLELAALSRATGNATYSETAERAIMVLLASAQRPTGRAAGLYQSLWNPDDGSPGDQRVGTGGGSDSFYEYLLKVFVLGGRTAAVRPYYARWEAAMAAVERVLLQRSKPGGLLYLADAHGPNWESPLLTHTMEHLSCFVGGMLVLGSEGPRAAHYMELAAGLSETCVEMYTRQPTGLSPDSVTFGQAGAGLDFGVANGKNIQRPEAVETLFYLWRRTGRRRYRDQGWAIFQAFETHCRAQGGFAGLLDVRQVPAARDRKQQSFFLAETLKYLYLLFADSDALDLDEWVLNTEAHPLRVAPRNSSLLASSRLKDVDAAELLVGSSIVQKQS